LKKTNLPVHQTVGISCSYVQKRFIKFIMKPLSTFIRKPFESMWNPWIDQQFILLVFSWSPTSHSKDNKISYDQTHLSNNQLGKLLIMHRVRTSYWRTIFVEHSDIIFSRDRNWWHVHWNYSQLLLPLGKISMCEFANIFMILIVIIHWLSKANNNIHDPIWPPILLH
jgi:hypothetical protein